MNPLKTMNKKQIYLAALVLILPLLPALYLYLLPKAEYTIERNIRYGFTLQNKTGQLLENVKFKVYAPVKQTSSQRGDKISATHAYQLEEDEAGNRILVFDFDKFPPYASRIVSIDARIYLAEQPNKLSKPALSAYLEEEKHIEVNDAAITKLAERLDKSEQIKTAKNISQWVNRNLSYAGYIKEDRGAAYALKKKKGDCTEYSYLYTALARARAIPTRVMGGYVYAEDRVLKAADYHNWAESYINGKWQIIDPQNNTFLDKQSHFIAMRIISSAEKTAPLLTNSHRFAASTDKIEIQMN